MRKFFSYFMILGLVVTLGAGVLLADDVKLDRSVMGAGGSVQTATADGKYVISGLIGQTVIETRTANGIELSQGFWIKTGKITGVDDQKMSLNSAISNFPNPFANSTAIRYELNSSSYVTLKIYDMLGNSVKTLFDGMQDAGNVELNWDARNEAGMELNSGSYVYELSVRPTASGDAQAYTLRNVMVIVK